MITIHKFKLSVGDGAETTLNLPVGHVVRHVGLDPDGAACVWVQLDTNAPKIDYTAVMSGTGREVPRAGRLTIGCFAGTVVQGAFVGHVWLA